MRYKNMKAAATCAGLATLLLSLPASALAQQGQQGGFSRFDSYNPSRCVVATRFIDGINRHDRPDTTRFTTGRDTLTAETIASIKECEQEFRGEASDQREVLDLARVKLFTAQDEAAITLARQHMGRQVKRPVEERAWEIYLIASDLLSARPARIEQARASLADLDKLGKAASGVRVAVHAAMMDQAIRHFDDEWMRAEAAATREAWLELDEEGRLWRVGPLATVALQRAAVESLVRGKDAALAVVDSTLGILPIDARMERGMLEGARRMYQSLGNKAAKLDAQFWYNTGTIGSERPAPGRVALVVPLFRPCVGGCYNGIVLGIRRIQHQFEAQDLDITFRYRTYGYYLDNAPVPPLEEARYDSTYFLHDVGLPGALAIAETKYSWLPDGRRSNQPTPDDQNFPGAAVIIIDRKGIIRYVASSWNPVLEERITNFIAELLQERPDEVT